jgi:hypothetical protein
MILSNPHSPPRYVFAAAAGLLRCCSDMLLRSWLKLKFIIWCLVNTNHIFFLCESQAKTKVGWTAVFEKQLPIAFHVFSPLSLISDTFPLLSQRFQNFPVSYPNCSQHG